MFLHLKTLNCLLLTPFDHPWLLHFNSRDNKGFIPIPSLWYPAVYI